jgi:alpha-beta hydrolase superfamily lysophospholipase
MANISDYREFYVLSSNGDRLFFRMQKPDGLLKGVVCIVHGLGDHSGGFKYLIDYLTSNSYGIIAIDLHGNGRSDGTRGDIASYDVLLDDVGLLLEQAAEKFPNQPLFLYGYSLGGWLVLNYALRRHPLLAGIISASPWLRLTEYHRIKHLIGIALSIFRPKFIIDAGINGSKVSHDKEFVKINDSDPLLHGLVSGRMVASACAAGAWAHKHAKNFETPLLLMHGNADVVTSYKASQRFYERVPSGIGALKIWEGDFHSLHNETNRLEIFDYVKSWLDEYIAGAAESEKSS